MHNEPSVPQQIVAGIAAGLIGSAIVLWMLRWPIALIFCVWLLKR